MIRDALWRLPEEALYFDDEARVWKVMATRGLGTALAVFIPVKRDAAGWHVALAVGESIPLVPVETGEWAPLRRGGGEPGCLHLCAIRYDLPSNHPDDSFLVRPGGAGNVAPAESLPKDISKEDLATLLARLVLRYPDRIENDVVHIPEEPPAARARSGGPTGDGRVGAGVPPNAARKAGDLQEFTLAFGSCQYPAGMLDRLVAQSSYRALALHLKQPGAREPERLLLLGDQVYTDATYGLLDPVRLDDRYRMPYEDLRDRDNGPFSALPQAFLSRVRMTLDDHEFVDNWEPWSPGARGERFRMGLAAFWEHQRRSPGSSGKPVWLQEQHDGWRLFMTDTRTERCYRGTDTIRHAEIMSWEQQSRLEEFLTRESRDELKVVTSAPMLLPRSREHMDDRLYLDNWQGYPASFHHLLGFLCERQVENVVFLSGDAHLACTADVTVRDLDSGKAVNFKSHHAPAMYAPYPFANETRWNLLLEDHFQFTADIDNEVRAYDCTVLTTVIDEVHDGCGLMTASRNGSRWSTKVDVLRERT